MGSITADPYCLTQMSHILPPIKTKWPGNLSDTTIKTQQDNVRSHFEPSNKEFLRITFEVGLKVDLGFQPPNSPDLNVLDLDVFNTIQRIQYQHEQKTWKNWLKWFGLVLTSYIRQI